jgi:hypothetical protein
MIAALAIVLAQMLDPLRVALMIGGAIASFYAPSRTARWSVIVGTILAGALVLGLFYESEAALYLGPISNSLIVALAYAVRQLIRRQ